MLWQPDDFPKTVLDAILARLTTPGPSPYEIKRCQSDKKPALCNGCGANWSDIQVSIPHIMSVSAHLTAIKSH